MVANDSAPERLRLGWYAVGLIVLVTVVVGASLSWGLWEARKAAGEIALSKAAAAFGKDAMYRHWAADHGGVYVPVSERTQPDPHLAHLEERDIVTASGRKLTLVSPMHMAREVHGQGRECLCDWGQVTAMQPQRGASPPDDWERDALFRFASGDRKHASIEEVDGVEHFRYMGAMVTEAACLQCHSDQGFAVGEVRGGVSVSFPMDSIYAARAEHLVPLFAGHGVVWLMGLGGVGFLVQGVRRRVDDRERSVASVRANEARLRHVVENMPMMMDAMDASGNFVVWNHECERVTGYSAAEIVGDPQAFAKLHPDAEYRQRMLAEWQQRENDFRAWEWETVCRNGERRVIAWSNISKRMPIPGWDTWGIGVDVTERRRADDVLRFLAELTVTATGEEFFRQIVQRLGEAMGFKHVMVSEVAGAAGDRAQVLAYWGDGAFRDTFEYELRGTPCEQVCGKTMCYYPAGVAGMFPDDAILAEMGVEAYLGTPIFDSDGNAVGILTLLHDRPTPKHTSAEDVIPIVASRIGAELGRLRAERAVRFQAMLLDQIGDHIIATDLDGRITYLNAALERYVGRSRAELVGEDMHRLGETVKRGVGLDEIVRQTRANGQWHGELVDVQPGEDEVVMDCRTWLAFGADGNPIGVCGCSTDVTDQKRTQEELARHRDRLEELVEERTAQLRESQLQLSRAERLASIGTLAGGLAHELNNPLGSILLAAQNVAEMDAAANASPMMETCLRDIVDNTQRCAELVQNVLRFARKEKMQRRPVDLNAVIRRAVDFAGGYVASRGGQIELDLSATLPATAVNEREVERVLDILLRNAAEAAVDRVTVAVRSERTPEGVRVSVADDGRGIAPQHMAHVFDPFFTTRRRTGGTGLGLSIAHGIVEEHGASIDVRSTEGKGTVFTLDFPITT